MKTRKHGVRTSENLVGSLHGLIDLDYLQVGVAVWQRALEIVHARMVSHLLSHRATYIHD